MSFICYHERPSILNIEPTTLEPDAFVTRFARSAQLLLAELLSFYPGHRILFIGRDMEYYYDAALILLNGLDSLHHKVSLINVSRDSLRCSLVGQYCQEKVMADGSPVVLVDSGFNGNVIRFIRSLFPKANLRGHLLCSASPDFPSSDGALAALNVSFQSDPIQRRFQVEKIIEHLPHFTGKCVRYKSRRGAIVPLSHRSVEEKNWRTDSTAFMSALRRAVDEADSRMAWQKSRSVIEDLINSVKVHSIRAATIVLHLARLFGTDAAVGENSGSQIPFGFGDFLLEAQERIRVGHLQVRVRCPVIMEEVLDLPLVHGRSMTDYGLVLDQPPAVSSDDTLIDYPPLKGNNLLNHQSGLFHALSQADRINAQPEIDPGELIKHVMALLKLPEGQFILRNIVEESSLRRLGIRFRAEIIAKVWTYLCGGQLLGETLWIHKT